MNISQRLRTCARHTGLDAVIELLNEAADEIDRLSGGHHPLPTLQPGDSHMESLIEAAIQGHADTREAMRWLVRQLVPATQPAEVTDEEIDYAVLQAVGFDGMGTQEMSQFDCRNIARAILALRPAQVPMPDDVVRDAERYRWLRQRVAASNPRGEGSWAYHYCQFPRPTSNPCYGNVSDNWGLDIDAAMLAASPAQKGGE